MKKSLNIHDRWVELKKLSEENDVPVFEKGNVGFRHFTQRQREVARYLVEGQTNEAIANHLGVKIVTVKLHVRNIFKILNVKNRTQAAMQLYQMQQGQKL